MKINDDSLRKVIREQIEILLEQDDLFADTEEDAGEEDTEEDAGEEEAEEDEEGGDDPEEEETAEEPKVEPSSEEFETLGKTVDDELTSLFIDFEHDALKAGKIEQERKRQVDKLATESRGRKGNSMKYLLYEEAAIPFDMEVFVANVARLVKNYDSLLDMESIIVKKAEDFLLVNHGSDKASEMLDILDLRFGINFEDPEDLISPIASGASVTAAEGGA
jgi:hypothetical protein